MQKNTDSDTVIDMKQTLTIRVGKEQLSQLRDLAKAEDRSLSAIIRRFIENGIKQSKKPQKIS